MSNKTAEPLNGVCFHSRQTDVSLSYYRQPSTKSGLNYYTGNGWLILSGPRKCDIICLLCFIVHCLVATVLPSPTTDPFETDDTHCRTHNEQSEADVFINPSFSNVAVCSYSTSIERDFGVDTYIPYNTQAGGYYKCL